MIRRPPRSTRTDTRFPYTTLFRSQLAQAQKQWAALPEATRPRVLLVSVDPERDSPDRIGEYAHAFHKDTLAATADIPALEAFARSLSLVFMKVPPPEGVPANQYRVDSSEERRVGHECVSTCRSRGSPY